MVRDMVAEETGAKTERSHFQTTQEAEWNWKSGKAYELSKHSPSDMLSSAWPYFLKVPWSSSHTVPWTGDQMPKHLELMEDIIIQSTTHWVQFVLPTCAWVWGCPPEHGQPTSGHTAWRKMMLSQHLWTASSSLARDGALWTPYAGMLTGLILCGQLQPLWVISAEFMSAVAMPCPEDSIPQHSFLSSSSYILSTSYSAMSLEAWRF